MVRWVAASVRPHDIGVAVQSIDRRIDLLLGGNAMRLVVHLLVHVDDGVAIEDRQRANVVGHLLRDQLVILLLLGADKGGEIEVQCHRDRNHCKRSDTEPDFPRADINHRYA